MLKRSLRFGGKSLYLVTRLAVVIATSLAIFGIVVAIALRYWILPDIEHYHQQIVMSASRAIGQPVEIGRIEAGWSGIKPRLSFSNIQILDRQGRVALSLSHVENVLSWMTLFSGELRLYSLEIDAPELSVRRDAQGQLYVAGMALSSKDTDSGLSDWLLHQSLVIVRNGRITWQDDLLQTPLLALNNVDLVIENTFSHHRFSVRATPPQVLAAEIDVRGDFRGNSFANLDDWRGEIFTQLDYAEVGAWKTWLPLPRAFKKGKGALRTWLGIEQGRVKQITADLSLVGVQTRLTEELPAMDLLSLHGRIGWIELEQGFEVTSQKLAIRMGNGVELKPTDLYLRLLHGKDEKISAGELRLNTVELASLGKLLEFIPLQEELKKQFNAFAPRGHFTDLTLKWKGEPTQLATYKVHSRFDDVGINRVGDLPGFSGLSGSLDARESDGTLSLNAHRLRLDVPAYLFEPLEFEALTARIDWQHRAAGWDVKVNNASLKNEDLEGTLYGTYQSDPQGPGSADVTVNLNRVAVNHTARYIPLHVMNDETYAWLQKGLLGGRADQFRLRVRGDLRDFPFPENRGGIFKIEAKAKEVGIQFLKEWPPIEHANADLLIEGRKLEVRAASATTLGATVQKVIVTLPNMLSKAGKLQVRGEAVGETAHSLEYIRNTPIRSHLGGFIDDVVVQGDGRLDLFLDIPLQAHEPVKVQGSYHFDRNKVSLGTYIPTFHDLEGDLAFTESAINAHGQANILDGPATILVSTSPLGNIDLRLTGRVNMDAEHPADAPPLVNYFHGGTDWRASATVHGNQTDVMVDSDLSGLELELPAPLTKPAKESMPTHFEIRSTGTGKNEFGLSYGSLLNAHLQSNKDSEGVWHTRRGMIEFGANNKPLNRDGIWISGTIPHLSMEGWGGVSLGNSNADEGNGLSNLTKIAGISLNVKTLDGYGVGLDGLHIGGFNRNGVITAQFSSRDLNGDLTWQTEDRGKLKVRLHNLTVNAMPSLATNNAVRKSIPKAKKVRSKTLAVPDVDVVIDRFVYKGKQLGKLDFLMAQNDHDIALKYLHLINPDGTLSADGNWDVAGDRTTANLKLAITDAGKILGRSGYPDSVQGGSGTLDSKLVWHGTPVDFNFASLDGSLQLNSGKGRFLKVDLGAGKLLAVLSLQALPQHVSLDFADIFSDGFQFESIVGNAQIAHGMLLTKEFKLNGSAANVTMQGQVDLNKETQSLHVSVLPNVGDSVSLLAFAGGPVVGAGVLLANKLLHPLDKLVSFEYNVSGSWADPKVEKIGQSKPALVAPAAAE